jgi:hypothetical protein
LLLLQILIPHFSTPCPPSQRKNYSKKKKKKKKEHSEKVINPLQVKNKNDKCDVTDN